MGRIARGARGKRDWRPPREIMIIEDFCSILKHSKEKEEFDLTKGSQRKNWTEIQLMSSQLGRIFTSRLTRCYLDTGQGQILWTVFPRLIHQKYLNLILFSLSPKMIAKIEKALHWSSIVDLRETMEKQQVGP